MSIESRGSIKKSISRHCELRGTKQEANQIINYQWIASGEMPSQYSRLIACTLVFT
ncbi:MAG: hypothetical protein LBB85_00765 [Dysgonamonadaceae bacterium]|nr:hypothetical protein [Dysgonamonadaceae bacterium]